MLLAPISGHAFSPHTLSTTSILYEIMVSGGVNNFADVDGGTLEIIKR